MDLPSFVEIIGNTPLVGLPAVFELPDGVQIALKLEGRNPSGSVKARAARSIVQEAERAGRLKPGGTILDASSGNTGIAYAVIAGQRGYRLVLCLPKNASAQRQQLLKTLGTEIVHTSPLEGTDGAQAEAVTLADDHGDWVYLNQYDNDANWRAHYQTTGPEIWNQTQGTVTHFVATVGTSGTLTGTGRYLREQRKDVQIVEVQPDSPLHGLEGVKHMQTARVPGIYDPGVATDRRAMSTERSFRMVRCLAHHGLLLGPSGGAAVQAAVDVARDLTHGVVVAIVPDSGSRYLSEPHIWTPAEGEVPCRLAS
ncbi:MAG: cysteine synthase family protein [Myxococcales bacterium]|nr:cysteine synthase family protein [Myxococcales bacterium]